MPSSMSVAQERVTMAATKPATKKKTATKKASPKRSVPELSDLILPEWLADDYISREFPGGHSEFDIMDIAMATGHNVLLWGPTGPGKTSAVMAYAALNGLPFDSIPCHGAIDDRAFFGGVMPLESTGNGGPKYRWVDGPVTKMVRYGGVLLLDEVSFLHPRIGAVLHPLLDKRRHIKLLGHEGETIEAHERFLVVAAYNPGYEGTRPLNQAFKNRFSYELEFDYDPDIEGELVKHTSLLVIAAKLRERHMDGDLQTPISTNRLMEFEDVVDRLSFEFAIYNFVNHFSLAERPVVQEVLELHRGRLEPDFGIENSFTPSGVDDEINETV